MGTTTHDTTNLIENNPFDVSDEVSTLCIEPGHAIHRQWSVGCVLAARTTPTATAACTL